MVFQKTLKGKKMKVLVTGVKGQLGYDVVKRLELLGIECLGVDIQDFDLTNEIDTKKYIERYNPEIIVHCAAYTAVDRAEEDREKCYNINVIGTRYIAQSCKALGAKMVYISTDYIFNGEGEEPFEVTQKPDPINFYGQTKYEGEKEVLNELNKYFIIRISWVFGINGNNFVKTMIRLAKEKDQLNVVSDQVGSPTYTYDLARLISDMIVTDQYGIYHATNEGYCSWDVFAQEIFRLAGLNTKVHPIKTEDYPTKAVRPKNSRLSKKSLDNSCFKRLPEWKDSLKKYINSL